MLGKDYERQDCSLARALEVIGERWTLLIVRDAFYGVRRFNDFHAHLDLPKAVLSARLSGLVEDGILARKPDPEHSRPPSLRIDIGRARPVAGGTRPAGVGGPAPISEQPRVQARLMRNGAHRRRTLPQVR